MQGHGWLCRVPKAAKDQSTDCKRIAVHLARNLCRTTAVVGSEVDHVRYVRQLGRKLELLLDFPGQRSAWLVFSMRQHDTRLRRRDGAEPGQQVSLPGVSAETAKSMEFRLYRDFLAIDAHRVLAIDEPP